MTKNKLQTNWCKLTNPEEKSEKTDDMQVASRLRKIRLERSKAKILSSVFLKVIVGKKYLTPLLNNDDINDKAFMFRLQGLILVERNCFTMGLQTWGGNFVEHF